MPKELRIGRYYLARRNGIFEIRWTDPATRASGPRRRSLGTRDSEEAAQKFAEFVVTHRKLEKEPLEQVRFADLVTRYWKHEGPKLHSPTQRLGIQRWLEHFGNATVGELTIAAQEAFAQELRRRGLANGSIRRIQSAGARVLSWAAQRGEIATMPPVLLYPDSTSRNRAVEPEEAAAFWNAIEDERLALFFMLGFNTGGRPEVLRRLTLFQVDVDRGLINLHPPNWPVTKKINPVVRITATLRPWLEGISGRSLVVGAQKKVLGKAWRATRTRAGLDPDFIPYLWRHTVQTVLDEAGVDERESDDWFGRGRQSKMGNWYTYRRIHRPGYLQNAAAALDHWFALVEAAQKESGQMAVYPLSRSENPGVRANCVSVPKLSGG